MKIGDVGERAAILSSIARNDPTEKVASGCGPEGSEAVAFWISGGIVFQGEETPCTKVQR